MPKRLFRAFTDDFRDHMRQHLAWPDERWVNSCRGKTMTRGAYALLQDGNIQSYDYILAILKAMLKETTIPEIIDSRNVLMEYVRSKGVPETEIEKMDAGQLAQYVCGPIRFRRERTYVRDAFERWLDLLVNALLLKRPSMDYVRFCDGAKDVRRAVDWMYIDAGRSVGGKRLSWDAARRHAESHLKVSFEDYVASAIQWNARCPWSVIQVQGERKKVGMCICVPVPDSVYDEVRRGNRSSHTVAAHELEFPTSQLIVEGLALRPREEGDRSFAETKAMFYAMLCQHAMLTTLPGIGTEVPMRLLSFQSTAANARRLRWGGYKPIGARTPVTGLELVERLFFLPSDDRQSILDAPILGVWLKLQAMLKGWGR